MIKCNSCNLEKEETEFSIRNDGKNIGKYRKTCKNCKNINQRKNYKKYKKNNPFLSRHVKLKASCKQRNIPYNLDEVYLKQIWTGFCPITGDELVWTTGHEERSMPNAAELDRFIPSLGYIKGNVSWVSRRMNNLKGDGTIEDLEKILKWMKNWKEPIINPSLSEQKEPREPTWNKDLKYKNEDINGEKNPAAKLTLMEVKEIRKKFSNKRGDYTKLSKEYKISTAAIRKIINNLTWKEE